MSRCIHHPGRASVTTINMKHYCNECQLGIVAARALVNAHVEPKTCFVWYVGGNRWQPIQGTGCAHWVAHQKGIRRGGANEQCLEGFTYRVPTLIQGMTAVALADVRVGDTWVAAAVNHTGLVQTVTPDSRPGQPTKITIRHDSSGQGGVRDNDFAGYFHSGGTFHR